MLECIGAKLNIGSIENGKMSFQQKSPLEFLDTDMARKIIKSISFPKIPKSVKFQYFKVAPRNAFSLGHGGAAFMAEFDTKGTKMVKKPSFVFGGISASFHHATEAEDFIEGKDLSDKIVLEKVFSLVDKAIKDDKDDDHKKFVSGSVVFKLSISVNYGDK